jgi:hypothetical protein
MVVRFHCGRGLKDDFSILRLVWTLWIVNASATQKLNYETKESRGQDRGQYRQQRPGWTAEVRLDSRGQAGQRRSGWIAKFKLNISCKALEVRTNSRGQEGQQMAGWIAEVRLNSKGQAKHQL